MLACMFVTLYMHVHNMYPLTIVGQICCNDIVLCTCEGFHSQQALIIAISLISNKSHMLSGYLQLFLFNAVPKRLIK